MGKKLKTVAARGKIIDEILKLFPDRFQLLRLGPYKPLLYLDRTTAIGVQTGVKFREGRDEYWKFYAPRKHEMGCLGLVCLLNEDASKVERYYLVRRTKSLGQRLRLNDRVLTDRLSPAQPI